MSKESKLEKLVKPIIIERFADDVTIVSVHIDRDIDEDGDEILHVTVVFDGKKKQLDPYKTIGIVRDLIPKILEAGESAFPVISYIAKSELRKFSPDTS